MVVLRDGPILKHHPARAETTNQKSRTPTFDTRIKVSVPKGTAGTTRCDHRHSVASEIPAGVPERKWRKYLGANISQGDTSLYQQDRTGTGRCPAATS
jgi:hypothetical protein